MMHVQVKMHMFFSLPYLTGNILDGFISKQVCSEAEMHCLMCKLGRF